MINIHNVLQDSQKNEKRIMHKSYLFICSAPHGHSISHKWVLSVKSTGSLLRFAASREKRIQSGQNSCRKGNYGSQATNKTHWAQPNRGFGVWAFSSRCRFNYFTYQPTDLCWLCRKLKCNFKCQNRYFQSFRAGWGHVYDPAKRQSHKCFQLLTY